MRHRGFSLVEVVAVLVLVAVLAAVGTVSFSAFVDRQRDEVARTAVTAALDAQQLQWTSRRYLSVTPETAAVTAPMFTYTAAGTPATTTAMSVGGTVDEVVAVAFVSGSGRCVTGVLSFATDPSGARSLTVFDPTVARPCTAETALTEVAPATPPTTTTPGPTTTVAPTTTTTPEPTPVALPAPPDPWTGGRVDIFAYMGNVAAGLADPTDFSGPYVSPGRTTVATPGTYTSADQTSVRGVFDNDWEPVHATGPEGDHWALVGNATGSGGETIDFSTGYDVHDYTVSPTVAHLKWANFNADTRIEGSVDGTTWFTLWTSGALPSNWNTTTTTEAVLATDVDGVPGPDQWRFLRFNQATANYNSSTGTGIFNTNSGTSASYLTFFTVYEMQLFGTVDRDLTTSTGSVPATFAYTGNVQTFVVPPGVTSLQVTARGASGGCYAWSTTGDGGILGGRGGSVTSTIAVTPGQRLYVNVGGRGTNSGGYNNESLICRQASFDPTDGWNGGARAGAGVLWASNYAAGGGGATDIRVGGTDVTDRVLVAGGGGGAGRGFAGGAGGSATGDGTAGSGAAGYLGGGGGTASAGGAGGVGTGASGADGTVGSGGVGPIAETFSGGGAGGGGYFGGGSGGACGSCSTNYYGGGGGGGSSWVDPAVGSGTTYATASQWPAHGFVRISLPGDTTAYSSSTPAPGTTTFPNTDLFALFGNGFDQDFGSAWSNPDGVTIDITDTGAGASYSDESNTIDRDEFGVASGYWGATTTAASVTFDFGFADAARTVTPEGIMVRWANPRGSDVYGAAADTLEGSNDGVTWTTLWTNPTTATDGSSYSGTTLTVAGFANTTAYRYLRINHTTPYPAYGWWGWGINELQLFGSTRTG